MKYARPELESIWSTARKLGHGRFFRDKEVGGIIDDHLLINTYRNIPCVDIINLGGSDGFEAHNDNIQIIDINTLKAVEQTLLNVIYSE